MKLEEKKNLPYFVLLKIIQHGGILVNFENFVKNIELYSIVQINSENDESY